MAHTVHTTWIMRARHLKKIQANDKNSKSKPFCSSGKICLSSRDKLSAAAAWNNRWRPEQYIGAARGGAGEGGSARAGRSLLQDPPPFSSGPWHFMTRMQAKSCKFCLRLTLKFRGKLHISEVTSINGDKPHFRKTNISTISTLLIDKRSLPGFARACI